MELGRLASKQATSPILGPFLVRRAEGARKSRKQIHAIRDKFPQLSREQLFFRSDPQVVGNGDLVVAGTYRNSGTGPNTERRNLPALGVPKSKRKVTTLSRMVVRNFFTCCVLTSETLEKSRARAENRQPQFPGARGNRKQKLPRYLGWLSANSFTVCVLADWTPGAENRKIRVFWAFLA